MKKTHAKPIRGKLEPFRQVLDPIFKCAYTCNGVEIFREYLKDAIALRMQDTLYSRIVFSENCLAIIHKYVKNAYEFSFIKCTILYYCNKKDHKINELNKNCSSFDSKDEHKSLQHAKQDCQKCAEHYLEKIKKKHTLSKSTTENCESMKKAAFFLCEYYYALYEKVLPKTISNEAYCYTISLDGRVAKMYKKNFQGEDYSLVNNSCTYRSLNIEAATELFCRSFTSKSSNANN